MTVGIWDSGPFDGRGSSTAGGAEAKQQQQQQDPFHFSKLSTTFRPYAVFVKTNHIRRNCGQVSFSERNHPSHEDRIPAYLPLP